MLFSSEVQMFHDAETLRKLISPQFLHCFVNVTLFRTRTETTDLLLWNTKKTPSEINRKSNKNQSEIVHFESSKSDRVSDLTLRPFSDNFGAILRGLGIHLPLFWPSWALRGRFLGPLGASWCASGPPNVHVDRFRINVDRFWNHVGRSGPHF